ERPPKALDPPAVVLRSVDGPAVDGIAPELAGLAVVVRRRARDDVRLEQLRVRREVGAGVGDVDRDVAEDAHALARGITAERRPLTLEADLAGDRLAARTTTTRRSRTGGARRSPL